MNLLHSVAEGGQTWAHRVRMVRQVLRIAAGFSMFVSSLFFFYWISELPKVLHYSTWYYLKGQICQLLWSSMEIDSEYWLVVSGQRYGGATASIAIERVLRASEPSFLRLLSESLSLLYSATTVFLWSFAASLLYFFLRGSISQRKELVSGQTQVPAWKLALRLRIKREASDIFIGRIPMVKGSETKHILVSGGTGSGKTNCFHSILPQIRKRGNRAVVVDTTGDFIRRYYRPGKDIILNPFNEKGAAWHPWVECSNQADFDSIAESFIPQSTESRDSYWSDAARALLSAVLQKTDCAQKTSALTRILLNDPLSELCDFVEGTKAAAHIDPNSEKTAASIRSVAASYLGFLDYLDDTTSPFSISEWVTSEEDDSWLFLSMNVAERSALRPLVSTWLSVAMRSLIRLEPNLTRCLWYICDELPSLQKLKDLDTFLVESRKYGGCGLLAIQSPAQLEIIYGREMTGVILANSLTKAIFYEHSPETAARISKMFGEHEVREYQEGISYGAHQMRDGVNISGQLRSRPLVSATDIQSLNPNNAWVRLPGNYLVAKTKVELAK